MLGLILFLTEIVPQIQFKPTSGALQQAIGAEIVKDGKTVTINASKEVIISSGKYLHLRNPIQLIQPSSNLIPLLPSFFVFVPGTFQTPQILELSGIGDERILSSVGIECIIDLPGVGENLRKCYNLCHQTLLSPTCQLLQRIMLRPLPSWKSIRRLSLWRSFMTPYSWRNTECSSAYIFAFNPNYMLPIALRCLCLLIHITDANLLHFSLSLSKHI